MTQADEPADLAETPAAWPAPAVAARNGGLPTAVVVAAFAVLAVVLFLVLSGRRSHAEARSLTTPTPDAAPSAEAPPLALPPALLEPAPAPAAPVLPPVAEAPPAPAAPAPVPQATGPSDEELRQRLTAPAVVVELGGAGRAVMLAQAGADPRPAASASPVAAPEPPPGAAMVRALEGDETSGVEAMADRLRVGRGAPGAAVATRMGDLGLTVPQGAVIPAVLETAINSDLPGYTRAIVSRDMRSFGGGTVLIPRGSRLIGQYRSAMALGQSRAFVIWTRVIRPDGVTVQIGSPATDELGRGGLTGDVDRHFFTRFGGSILLSVLNAGIAALADGPTTTISIGSPGQAAAAASAVQPENVPPTIKVAQGEAIRIFVARDLDFTMVGPGR